MESEKENCNERERKRVIEGENILLTLIAILLRYLNNYKWIGIQVTTSNNLKKTEFSDL